MTIWSRTTFLGLLAILALHNSGRARADFNISGSFGPNGDVGFANSPSNLSIGFGVLGSGSIYQMDGYVNDTNSSTNADLGNGAPTGIGYSFNSSEPTSHQLLLTYKFTNNTGAALQGFRFVYYVDPDIGSPLSAALYNVATVVPGSVLGPLGASSFQAGDAEYSSILYNASQQGVLDNVNSITSANPGDAAIALGFNIGSLAIGQSGTVEVLLSDNQTSVGSFAITQSDSPSDTKYVSDTLTVSGYVVPEPSSMVLLSIAGLTGLGCSVIRGRRPRNQA